ncbi:unnamed protein product [Pleuronectes platessa]|uniref:Uncharacterized protein n=1 Tax=Pleuronectes platessa TaxID=8262 RepID=A0A9N7UV75_PLEPL|nr:unnamed protein product [Pleuronectes platessa]
MRGLRDTRGFRITACAACALIHIQAPQAKPTHEQRFSQTSDKLLPTVRFGGGCRHHHRAVQRVYTHLSEAFTPSCVEPTKQPTVRYKKGFRKLALEVPPDKSRSADAETTFREIVRGDFPEVKVPALFPPPPLLRALQQGRRGDSTTAWAMRMYLENQVFTDAADDTVHISFSDSFHDFNALWDGGVHVYRIYEDLEWLQHHLFSQEERARDTGGS